MLGPAGFDAANDIEGITVNRWAHGYAYEYESLFDPEWKEASEPWVMGRQRLEELRLRIRMRGPALIRMWRLIRGFGRWGSCWGNRDRMQQRKAKSSHRGHREEARLRVKEGVWVGLWTASPLKG